jgi:mannose-6-phosphate isomerase
VPKNNLHIDVLGTSITISADENPEYLNNLLETFRQAIEHTQNSTGLTDPLKTAILTGFLLCDEAQKGAEKSRQTGKDTEREAEDLTLNIISRLNDILDLTREAPVQPLYKLRNSVKNYDWGSPWWIPELLGEKNISRVPWAELWMGVHPAGPSRITGEEIPETGELSLPDLIARDPLYFLGEETQKKFGGLPFLFKVLAAAKPLSIQAHPNLEQAKEGWNRENLEGLPFNAPGRNYKDPNHKPEILCALSSFKAMCGFREPREIQVLMGIFSKNIPPALGARLDPLIFALGLEESPLRDFLSNLFTLNPETLEDLSEYGREQRLEETYPEYTNEWELVRRFAGLYPGDPGVIAPLYLNLINLAPGEAVFLPAGVLHAYVHGLGVELMANSDNVLRGGLTPKHIDLKELFRVLSFSPFKPRILRPGDPSAFETANKDQSFYYKYPSLCEEFSLAVIKGGENRCIAKGPFIFMVTEGEVRLTDSKGVEKLALKQGESAFIPAGEGELGLSGSYTLYAAGVGDFEAGNS